MNKTLLLLPVALGLTMTACDEPGFFSAQVTTTRSGYYDNGDFYYVDRTPYSRSYGPLLYRNDRYYYRRSGRLVIYDRPTRRWRDSDRRVREYRSDRRDDYNDRRDDRRDDWRDRRDDRDEDRDEDREDQREDWRDRRR